MDSFFEIFENKSNEALLQRTLYYALIKDICFRRAFCQWLGEIGEPGKPRLEEPPENRKGRYDIVIPIKGKNSIKIELKSPTAGITGFQYDKDSGINFFIVPKNRWDEYRKYLDEVGSDAKIKTWEDMNKDFIECNLYCLLFSGLEQYLGSGLDISKEQVLDDFQKWQLKTLRWRDYITPFLRQLSGAITNKWTPLQLTDSSSRDLKKPKLYWGKNIYNKHRRDSLNLWIGFYFNNEQKNDDGSSSFALVLLCHRSLPKDITGFFSENDWADSLYLDFIISSKSEVYTVENVVEQVSHILDAYSVHS
ncbi:MAG TPA: hypothetical protein VM123_01300 [archaeon]|nr:hypothetical protein [archaeon]